MCVKRLKLTNFLISLLFCASRLFITLGHTRKIFPHEILARLLTLLFFCKIISFSSFHHIRTHHSHSLALCLLSLSLLLRLTLYQIKFLITVIELVKIPTPRFHSISSAENLPNLMTFLLLFMVGFCE